MSKSLMTLTNVKQALRDHRFRDTLPENLADDVTKYLQNPGCACNAPFYRRILSNCKEQLLAYYPGKELPDLEAEIRNLSENNWTVINCKLDELESRLRKLPPGRKQIAVARYENEVTVIVNELNVVHA